MPRPQKSIAEQLRAAIATAEQRGVTRYQIAKASGVSEPTVMRVADGTAVPKLDTAAKLAAAVGYVLRLDKVR